MDTALFLPLLGMLLLLIAGAVLLLALGYHRLITHLEQRDQTQQNPAKKSLAEADQLVARALHQSKKLLQESESKAEDIVEDAQFFTASTQKEWNTQIEHISTEQMALFQQLVQSLRTEMTSQVKKMQETTTQNMQEELKTFHTQLTEMAQALQTKLVVQQQDHLKASAKQLAEHHQSLDAYRTAAIEAIERQAQDAVTQIATQVLPKSISLENHEQLIKDALTNAKNTHAI